LLSDIPAQLHKYTAGNGHTATNRDTAANGDTAADSDLYAIVFHNDTDRNRNINASKQSMRSIEAPCNFGYA
jgi:hypothetical protein